MPLELSLAAAGAAITIGYTMVTALRLHTFAVRHAPWIGPPGLWVLAGLVVGVGTVALWFVT